MFEIIGARKEDAGLILHYIKELAVAEEFPFEVTVTKDYIENNFFLLLP